LPRRTDSSDPADWLWIAESDLSLVELGVENERAFYGCRGKLAEVLEKVLKAELIRTGWTLEKTHDLNRLLDALIERKSDLLSTAEPLCDAFLQIYFTDRYPGFDLDDPNWPELRKQVENVRELLAEIKSRVKS
jgi:HEPN domain-containing protein